MSPGFKNLHAKVQTLKSILLELTNGLTKFSKTRTASDQIGSSAVDRYFRDEINFKFEVESDLISLLASELFTTLKSNSLACFFALGLLKEDNGYYSDKLKENENQCVHICLGDTDVSAAIHKIVVQKKHFNECVSQNA